MTTSLFAVASDICARCDGTMVTKPDAVGRDRKRCPRCDGVSAPRPRHPDDAMLPQGLVPANSLPPVEPGQLRCQGCARGVDGDVRFCVRCTPPVRIQGANQNRRYKPKQCKEPSCGREFTPTGPRSEYCEVCR